MLPVGRERRFAFRLTPGVATRAAGSAPGVQVQMSVSPSVPSENANTRLSGDHDMGRWSPGRVNSSRARPPYTGIE